jgi:3-oxoacyl-[acyl-carrier-protein] synthase II
MPAKETRKVDPFIQYGIAASVQAIKDAGLEEYKGSPSDIGVAISAGIGGIGTIGDQSIVLNDRGPKKMTPHFVPATIVNMAAGHVSQMFNFQGPNFSVSTACATGVHNIGLAVDMIRLGRAKIMVAGGTERACAPLGLGGFAAASALSTRNDDPKTASRPWDKGRDGFVMADGAAVVVVESLSSAQARGATIYAEVLGFGMSGDAHHVTAPREDGAGAQGAMRAALADAKLDSTDFAKSGYVNAHGTSTPRGDIAEIRAMKAVFANSQDLVVSSTKSMTGHLLGAAGSLETMIIALALQKKQVPPTINLSDPDDECDLDLVPNTGRDQAFDYAMSNSFGFGGTNASIILGKAK